MCRANVERYMKRLFSLLLLGCGGPEALRDPLTVQVKAVPTTPRVERPLPPLYVPADGDAVNFELANDARGMVVSGERIVVRGSDFRHVPNAWDVQLSGGIEIPRTLGGGYLFFSKTALFRAGTFDGPTEPWLFFLHELESIQVGQGFVLAQADGGIGMRLISAPGSGSPQSRMERWRLRWGAMGRAFW